MTRLPQRLPQRALALGILAAILAGLLYGIVFPVLDASADDGAIERSEQLLAGYQRLAALRPQVEARLAAQKQAEAAVTGLWPGATPAQAATALQGETRRLVESAGGKILSIEPLPPGEEGGFDRIGVRLQLSLPMTSLPGLLQAFDTHSPYLFLDKIDLHAPEAQDKSVPILTIRWEVAGYRGEKPA